MRGRRHPRRDLALLLRLHRSRARNPERATGYRSPVRLRSADSRQLPPSTCKTRRQAPPRRGCGKSRVGPGPDSEQRTAMIKLYSDTQTKPSEGMRKAMYDAEVGDEQRKQDPTATRLQERVAELLGKEDALFLPSGTMC